MQRVLLRFAALVLFGSTAACSVRPNIPLGTIPPAVPPAEHEMVATKSLVKSGFKSSGHEVYESGPEYRRVKKIVDRLSRAAGADGFSYPVLIVDAGKEMNAMAVQDNTMVVYSELLRKVPSDEEVSTVIAHEVAHMIAKHGSDNTAQEREGWVSVGSSVLGAAASYGAQAAGAGYIGSNIAGSAAEATTSLIGTGAVVRSYDRKLEYEADQVGLMLMGKAGYNPEAAVRFWSKSEELFGGDTGGIFLSTHPSAGNRLERLREAMPKAQEYYSQYKSLENLEPTSGSKKKAKK